MQSHVLLTAVTAATLSSVIPYIFKHAMSRGANMDMFTIIQNITMLLVMTSLTHFYGGSSKKTNSSRRFTVRGTHLAVVAGVIVAVSIFMQSCAVKRVAAPSSVSAISLTIRLCAGTAFGILLGYETFKFRKLCGMLVVCLGGAMLM